ncbi:MAG TPA: hypothetical protein VKD22_10315 [Ramlibacter sp.]|nr:hypothetical protein [Ramlibacter sp.]
MIVGNAERQVLGLSLLFGAALALAVLALAFESTQTLPNDVVQFGCVFACTSLDFDRGWCADELVNTAVFFVGLLAAYSAGLSAIVVRTFVQDRKGQ